jgi:predicted nucleic acid-binding protein
VDTLFLDANILFSAVYQEGSGLARLWKLSKVRLVTSFYAIEEARRNLKQPDQLERLESYLLKLDLIDLHREVSLPKEIKLRDKDRPILAAAIDAKADYLITGDVKDFGVYFGKTIAGVTVVTPADYLRMYAHK